MPTAGGPRTRRGHPGIGRGLILAPPFSRSRWRGGRRLSKPGRTRRPDHSGLSVHMLLSFQRPPCLSEGTPPSDTPRAALSVRARKYSACAQAGEARLPLPRTALSQGALAVRGRRRRRIRSTARADRSTPRSALHAAQAREAPLAELQHAAVELLRRAVERRRATSGSPSSLTPPCSSERRASERETPNASASSAGRWTSPSRRWRRASTVGISSRRPVLAVDAVERPLGRLRRRRRRGSARRAPAPARAWRRAGSASAGSGSPSSSSYHVAQRRVRAAAASCRRSPPAAR